MLSMTISSLSFKSEQATQTQKQKPVRSFVGALGALAVRCVTDVKDWAIETKREEMELQQEG